MHQSVTGVRSLNMARGIACFSLLTVRRNLLAIFAGTIVGIITTPLPLGAVAMLGLGVSMLTKTLTFAEAFSAFANEIP